VTTCQPGFGDCNDDLGMGPSGNGCETSVSANLKNCGACGTSCKLAGAGIAACEVGECVGYTSGVGTARAVTTTPHGSVGGQAYDQTCPEGQVLVGLDVATTGDIAFGINVLCASLTLNSASGFTVGEPTAPKTMVGGIIDPLPPTVRFMCPANTIVAGVAGVTYLWTDGTRVGEPSIRSISLACNEVALDAQRRIVFTPKMVVDIGDRNGEVELYTDMCGEAEAVVGFKGYAGAYIDGLQTYCSAITLSGSKFEGTVSPK
jgi:hypothetical protein